MGSWFSSILTLKSLLYRPKQLSISAIVDPNPDPFFLLSAAAEIAALQRRMEATLNENRVRVESPQYNPPSPGDMDTDLEDEAGIDLLRDEKDDTSSDEEPISDDGSCPALSLRRQREIFERQRKMAFRGRIAVGNPETFHELREDIQCACLAYNLASTSVANLCSQREITKPRGGTSMLLGVKTAILNQFLPNCRRQVDKLRSKSFCCSFVKCGTELVVASQDERIRFFEQRGPRDRYLLKDIIHVPITSWSILDVALTRKGDALCYGTWKDSVFFAKQYENSWETSTSALQWTELPLPNQDLSSMAVFSLRFSHRGHEILCGGSDRSLHVFDLQSMSRVTTIPEAHADDVNAVCYGDTESNLLYSGGDDGLVKVFDRRAFGELDYQPVGVFAGHRDGITYIDARGDDRYLLSNSKDQTVKLWDLRRFSSDDTVRKTVNCVRQQSWDYRWQPAPPATYTPLKGDTSVITLRGHSVLHTLVRAKFSPARTGRRFIYTGCARGEVVLYDLLGNVQASTECSSHSNPVIRRLSGHVAVVRDVDWNPSRNEIVTCAWDGVTAIWRWDERHDHITSSETNQMGAEDSCDESYQPLMKRRRAQRRKQPTRQRRASRIEEPPADAPQHELHYSF
ncbi:hypothetical protein Q1695_009943 [Nippostrongylus brasiliensis]|nr:hypothetical protein Q1695_009943 [Nippostrongylus brasiliensis]